MNIGSSRIAMEARGIPKRELSTGQAVAAFVCPKCGQTLSTFSAGPGFYHGNFRHGCGFSGPISVEIKVQPAIRNHIITGDLS